MLINGRQHKIFRMEDMRSLISFRAWIHENLSLYPEEKDIPTSHVVDFLDYLSHILREQKVKDKKEWMDRIDTLKESAQKDSEK